MQDRIASFLGYCMRRPRLAALSLGVLAAMGYPPIGAWPVSLFALVGFVALLFHSVDWKQASILGWLFGWTHLAVANNWIATAFTYQAEMPPFLGWFAVPLLALYLAVYPALAALCAHLVAGRTNPLAFGGVLAAAWIVTEWLRSWVFTGYPWPPLGMLLLGDWERPGIAMLLPWLGTYALSGLAVLVAALLAWLVLRRRMLLGSLGAVLFAAGMLAPIPAFDLQTDNRYSLIQPLIPQDEIDDASKFEEQFARIAELTLPGRDRSRLVLWPESAIPDYLEDGYPQRYYERMTANADPAFARQRIGSVIGPEATLLTGAVNLDFEEKAGIRRAVSARNSVLVVDGQGEITAHYAKAHLVPYGEYLPVRWLLEPIGLTRLVAGTIDYLPGPGPATLDLDQHGKVGIQICYEIVFSGQVVDPENRPDYIFNPSNDGWFGTWGPPQHLAQARMRAIEEGLPVLRSTTTGISAVIDANGVVLQSIGRNEAGRLDGTVPAAKMPTPFAKLGNALSLGWAGLLLIVTFLLPRLVARVRPRG